MAAPDPQTLGWLDGFRTTWTVVVAGPVLLWVRRITNRIRNRNTVEGHRVYGMKD